MLTPLRPLTALPAPIPLLKARDVPHPERSIARGELTPVRRGIYASTTHWNALAPWDRYLARVHAVAVSWPDAVFSHESAAVLQGLPVFGDPIIVHLIAGPGATSGVNGGIRVHTGGASRELHVRDGLLMTSPIDTAVDLARSRHEVVGLSAADAALRTDPTATVEALVARNESRHSSRGRRHARWALHRADGAAETVLESASRAAVEWLGYPEPELQWHFGSTAYGEERSDFWWPGARLAGEADGDLKYDGRFGDAPALLRERRLRDTRIRRRARAVAHWGWTDVADFTALDGILRGAGLVRTFGEDVARLAGMRHALAGRPFPGRTADRLAPRPPARRDLRAET
ncbi:hypothetical protein [Microbacterium sp. cx-59]|uniref:hypothetical protein n=1 Tax=Microbacterium sp. cx-59 TaxID=2891207 RepID=UPI001E51272B|nr:hypothetical protein [Microbacterium sp. cx-59]MCC4906841.1 hypothetical protein [Microbacterium sp. cx-59]